MSMCAAGNPYLPILKFLLPGDAGNGLHNRLSRPGSE